ncbi:MAG: indole-3-glycerol-phosphate synthase [Desulfurococcales archaeon]|nr:indole-3-glycerol-phosphate synthase [Desulfurococcales archaeon]
MSFLARAGRWSRERVEILNRLRGAEYPGKRSFKEALEEAVRDRGYALIIEYKRCSPSTGFISYKDPEDYIHETSHYASAYSVLTEPRWFCGSLELIPVFSRVKPVLMKDFIIDRVQLEVAASIGASGILLITGLLDGRLGSLCREADRLGLDVLLESSNASEALEAHSRCPNSIMGINARDLNTLKVDLEALPREIKLLRRTLGDNVIIVAESGVNTAEDAIRVIRAGANAVLIGTAVMKRPELLGEIHRKLGTVLGQQ